MALGLAGSSGLRLIRVSKLSTACASAAVKAIIGEVDPAGLAVAGRSVDVNVEAEPGDLVEGAEGEGAAYPD